MASAFSSVLVLVKLEEHRVADCKKQESQQIQLALEKQMQVISEKKDNIGTDLAQVEPAVIEAQQGKWRHHLPPQLNS